MIKLEKKEIMEIMNRCYHVGLIGGCKITPVELENGKKVSKDVNYFYHNSNVKVIFFFGRCPSGMWYDLVRIRFENEKTGKIVIYESFE